METDRGPASGRGLRARVDLAGAVLLVAAVCAAAATGLGYAAVPAAAAAAGLLAVARGRLRPCVTASGVAGLSLAATGLLWWRGRYEESERLVCLVGLAELLGLLVLVVLALRYARGLHALLASAAQALAVACWPTRFAGVRWPAAALDVAGFGSALVLLPVLLGLYLRGLDDARRRSVTVAGRAGAPELAHGLTDFVAHDVSGMVTRARAGAVLAGADPARAAAVLRRVEQAGRQARGALDRTAALFRAGGPLRPGGRPVAPDPGLAELARLVARFTAAGAGEAGLEVDPRPGDVPREVSVAAYRVVAAALEEIRQDALSRPARAARRIDVLVRRTGGPWHARLEVTVTDDGGTSPGRAGLSRWTGPGRAESAAGVEALGGTLDAGPYGSAGGRVTAALPLEESA
ncbi:hypothetical protein [Kitasatospora sp. NBC_00315]|uniref:hypothetical protein n=1 Tax=Kitasatospora sp. NBC_00315 TaxID=2975963 RepID=UPI00324E518F